MQEPIYLTDLGKCLPGAAISATPTNHTWQLAEYDAGEIKGTMLAAQALVDAPDVTLPVDVTGWHAISIGFWPGIYFDSLIKYRLSTEEVFTVIQHRFEPLPTTSAPAATFHWNRSDLVETFGRYVDFTGADGIVLGKQNTGHPRQKAFIAYVKLQPLSAEQVEEIQRDRARTDTRRVVAINDSEGLFGIHSPRTKNQLLEQVELYRHSDVGMVLWGNNLGDLALYPSKVTKSSVADGEVFPNQEQKEAWESHHALANHGVLPFKAVMDHCHSMGLEFHPYFRLTIGDHVHPFNTLSTEPCFLQKHPHCRMVAQDGTPMAKASYAFPELRDFMVSLIEEAMQYDIDGVTLCTIRGPNYCAYEQPVIDDFRKLYGEDAREVPTDDQRLLKLRAGYFTEFVRAVRRAADKHGKRRGRKIQVSTWIESSDERMLHLGYDSYTWIEEKLLDFVIASGPERFLALARESGCRVFEPGSAAWPDTPMEGLVHVGWRAYANKADGMCMWDLNFCQFYPERWAILSRMGHKAEFLDTAFTPPQYPQMKRTQLLSVRGRDFAHTEGKGNPQGSPPEMLVMYSGG